MENVLTSKKRTILSVDRWLRFLFPYIRVFWCRLPCYCRWTKRLSWASTHIFFQRRRVPNSTERRGLQVMQQSKEKVTGVRWRFREKVSEVPAPTSSRFAKRYFYTFQHSIPWRYSPNIYDDKTYIHAYNWYPVSVCDALVRP